VSSVPCWLGLIHKGAERFLGHKSILELGQHELAVSSQQLVVIQSEKATSEEPLLTGQLV
jgi:hypothetical protein